MLISIQGFPVPLPQEQIYWLDETMKTEFLKLAESLAENQLSTHEDNAKAKEVLVHLNNIAGVRGTLLEDQCLDLQRRIDKVGSLTWECAADDAGNLDVPIVTSDITSFLHTRMPFLGKVTAKVRGYTHIKELGLFTLLIPVGGQDLEVKLWVVPLPDPVPTNTEDSF